MRWLILLSLTLPAAAEQWELGVAGGYGVYRNASIFAPAGVATAGFRNRFSLSVVAGERLNDRVSGEIRFTFQDGDPFLSAAGRQTNIQGHSHAVHYDVIVHLTGGRIRPYLAAGAGAKRFRVSGPENPLHPLAEFGRLTTASETKLLATAGGGLRIVLGRGLVLRLDFRDYLTPFPKRLIEPVPFATPRGFFHQFTTLVGIGFAW